MDYREWPPHPALRPFVRTYWALSGSAGEASPQPLLPDGASELIVHRERPFRRYTAARGAERQSERLFVGQYFDQSHMIRDFLAFAGSSPDDLRRRLGQMTAFMLAVPSR